MIDRQSRTTARQALLLGLLGVTIFGLTLPATRLAVADFDPLFVTAGGALVGGGGGPPPALRGGARPPHPPGNGPACGGRGRSPLCGFPLARGGAAASG